MNVQFSKHLDQSGYTLIVVVTFTLILLFPTKYVIKSNLYSYPRNSSNQPYQYQVQTSIVGRILPLNLDRSSVYLPPDDSSIQFQCELTQPVLKPVLKRLDFNGVKILLLQPNTLYNLKVIRDSQMQTSMKVSIMFRIVNQFTFITFRGSSSFTSNYRPEFNVPSGSHINESIYKLNLRREDINRRTEVASLLS